MAKRTILRLAGGAAIWVLSAAALAMPSDAQNPDNAASVRAGKSVAARYCARCHAIGPSGKSRNPKSPPFRTIVPTHHGGHLAGDLFIDGTVVRHPGMPQFELRPFEVDGLIAYMRLIAHR